MSRDAIACIALFALVLLLFLPARRFEFINYDDLEIVSDPVIRAGFTPEGFRYALTTPKLANWDPITVLSHMADAQLFGPDNAAGAHFTNVLIHTLNAVLLFVLLRATTGSTWMSLASSSLWAMHPLRVESVAWVAGRVDLLCTFFTLLAILSYVRYVRRPTIARYVLVCICFALGFMCKPMIVSLPVVLLLLDYWPIKRPARLKLLMVEKVPLAVMAGGMCLLTVIMRKYAMVGGLYPLPLRLENSLWSYARYLGSIFYPMRLAVFYPYDGSLPGTRIPIAGPIGGAVCLIGITAIALLLACRFQRRAPLVGWLWFVITLLPAIGLIQVGWQSMADRYTYFPQMGLTIAVVWLVGDLLANRRKLAIAALAACAPLLLVLAIMTSRQLQYWRDSVTLFTHALEVTDHNHVAHACLGEELEWDGAFDAAIAQYQEQFRILPSQPEPLYNIGRILANRGQASEAQAYYERALAIRPDYPDATLNLAHAHAMQGRDNQAIDLYRRGLTLKPEAAKARLYLARELLKKGGDLSEAQTQLRRAREDALRQHDSTLADEIESELARLAATQPTQPAATSRALPIATQSTENHPR